VFLVAIKRPMDLLLVIEIAVKQEFAVAGLMVGDGPLETLRKFSPIVLCDYNDSNTFKLAARNLTPIGYDVRPGPPVCAVRC